VEVKKAPRGFQPGVSGNPGGRTKAHRELARYIREKTGDGTELADICLKIARNAKAEPRVRLMAVEWLGDRGIGKPVQAVELRLDTDNQPAEQDIDWSQIPLDQREKLLEALSALDQIAAPAEPDGPVEH